MADWIEELKRLSSLHEQGILSDDEFEELKRGLLPNAPDEPEGEVVDAGVDPEIEELRRLSSLHESGILSDSEFAAEKARILGLSSVADEEVSEPVHDEPEELEPELELEEEPEEELEEEATDQNKNSALKKKAKHGKEESRIRTLISFDKGGSWAHLAAPVRTEFIVIIGDMLERLTNGALLATPCLLNCWHRIAQTLPGSFSAVSTPILQVNTK